MLEYPYYLFIAKNVLYDYFSRFGAITVPRISHLV
jgi:hypothetical protein